MIQNTCKLKTNSFSCDSCDELNCQRYIAYQQGRVDAINECYNEAKIMMDDIKYHQSNKRTGKTHALYCIQALEFLRQAAEKLKECNNGKIY